jgi:Amt family ammonium transporter
LLCLCALQFNGGSAGAANALAVQAVINTNIAAASAMLSWLLLDNLRGLKFRATGLCFGAVAGMVVVTPAAGEGRGFVHRPLQQQHTVCVI